MSILETELNRHLGVRQRKLEQHETSRLNGDVFKDTLSPNSLSAQAARTTYEETVRRSDIWSSAHLREKTEEIIISRITDGTITQKQGTNFMTKADLGYAGETRIATVAANCRAKRGIAITENDAGKWREIARQRTRNHNYWLASIVRVNETIQGNPILWESEIDNDKATIYRDAGETDKAIKSYQRSSDNAMRLFTESSGDTKIAAASAGGVAMVKQARLAFDLYREGQSHYSLKGISMVMEEGRRLVQLAGKQDLNFERVRVIEMWYTQFLIESKQYLKIPGTFTTWLWLLKNHEGTKEMAKDRIKAVWTKAKDRVFEPGLYAQM